MKKLIIICAVGMLLMKAAPAVANVTIDFESLANLEVVDNQFLALGADFNGSASVLSKSEGWLSDDFPPHSGDKVIYDYPESTIKVDAVGTLWTMAGGYVTGNNNITLTAYDSADSVLGSDSTGGANYMYSGTGIPPNKLLSVSAPGIAYVTFSDSGCSYTIDDLTFTPVHTPAPGGILLAGVGIGLVGWLRRHRIL